MKQKKFWFKMAEAMRSIAIAALIAVIGFSMTACKEDGGGGGDNNTYYIPETNGRLTITGLSSYVGNYIQANGSNLGSDIEIFATADISGTIPPTITYGMISSDSITLKVWKVNIANQNVSGSFSGSENFADLTIIIHSSAHANQYNIVGSCMTSVTFNNGNGNAVFSPYH